jgi:antitoxin component HigA of HigAB toxin-antitoxin module
LQAKEQYIEAIHKNVNFEYDLSEVKKIEERFMDVHEYNIRAYNEKQLHDI